MNTMDFIRSEFTMLPIKREFAEALEQPTVGPLAKLIREDFEESLIKNRGSYAGCLLNNACGFANNPLLVKKVVVACGLEIIQTVIRYQFVLCKSIAYQRKVDNLYTAFRDGLRLLVWHKDALSTLKFTCLENSGPGAENYDNRQIEDILEDVKESLTFEELIKRDPIDMQQRLRVLAHGKYLKHFLAITQETVKSLLNECERPYQGFAKTMEIVKINSIVYKYLSEPTLADLKEIKNDPYFDMPETLQIVEEMHIPHEPLLRYTPPKDPQNEQEPLDFYIDSLRKANIVVNPDLLAAVSRRNKFIADREAYYAAQRAVFAQNPGVQNVTAVNQNQQSTALQIIAKPMQPAAAPHFAESANFERSSNLPPRHNQKHKSNPAKAAFPGNRFNAQQANFNQSVPLPNPGSSQQHASGRPDDASGGNGNYRGNSQTGAPRKGPRLNPNAHSYSFSPGQANQNQYANPAQIVDYDHDLLPDMVRAEISPEDIIFQYVHAAACGGKRIVKIKVPATVDKTLYLTGRIQSIQPQWQIILKPHDCFTVVEIYF